MRPGKRRALNKENAADAMIEQAEKLKAAIRAKVEHPFRVIEAPVRICQSALSRFEEKHGAALHAVCAVQFVDGAQQVDGSRGMSAPEIRARALYRAKKALRNGEKTELLRFDREIPPFEKLTACYSI